MAEANFNDLKQLVIKNCMLRVSPDEIKEETALFGPDSLGLDSIDALQLTVAIEAEYGVAPKDPEVAQQAYRSLGALKAWLDAEQAKSAQT